MFCAEGAVAVSTSGAGWPFLGGVSIEHLVILAPGLLGGSVARAARARGLAGRITIWARRAETREALRGQPWCDAVAESPEAAVRDASLVVLAAPVTSIIELARQVGPQVAAGAVVTDVGSVKTRLCHEARTAMRAGVVFVGSHPMAGSEKTGWENGSETLFEKRTCFVTPHPDTPGAAVRRVADFWRDLGSMVATLTPEQHDEVVAHISHLPQAVATVLADTLAGRPGEWRHLAGGGLRDTTRIAASDATMWVEIFQQNRDHVLRALERFSGQLQDFQAALANHDWPAVRRQLEQGKVWRDGFRP